MCGVAWSGAGLFAASLLYFSYTYFIVLGAAHPGSAESLPGTIAFDLGLFSAFALHHSILARSGAKALVARFVPARLERSLYVWVASLLFMGTCGWWRPLPGVAWQAPGAWQAIGYLVQISGIALTLRSASRIDVWELAGVRQACAPHGREAGRPGKPAALEISGPYRWLRHPIYLGWMLLVFGTPMMTNTRLLFAGASTFYLVLAIPFEERSLTDEFGPAYAAYQQRVRWRLVPGLW